MFASIRDYEDFKGSTHIIQVENDNIIGAIIDNEDSKLLSLRINFAGLGTLNTPPGLLHFAEHVMMRDSYSKYMLNNLVSNMNAGSHPTEMELYSAVELVKNDALKLDQGFDKIMNVFDSMKEAIDVMHSYSNSQIQEIMDEQLITIDQEIIKSDSELNRMITDAILHYSTFRNNNGLGTSEDIRKYKVSDMKSMMLDILLNANIILTLTINETLLDKHDMDLYSKIEEKFYDLIILLGELRENISCDKITKKYLNLKERSTRTGYNSNVSFTHIQDTPIPLLKMTNSSKEELKNTVVLAINKPISQESTDEKFMANLCMNIIDDYIKKYLRHERNLIYGYNGLQVLDLNNMYNNRGFIFHADRPAKLVDAIINSMIPYILKDLNKSKLDFYINDLKMDVNHGWIGIVVNGLYFNNIKGLDDYIEACNQRITVKSVKDFIKDKILTPEYTTVYVYEKE